MSLIHEENLWYRLRNGEEDAFEQIYDQYADRLFQYGSRYTGDHELVEDCIQDLFIRIWEKRKSIGPTTSILYYLLASMRRSIFRKIRQENKRHSLEHELFHIQVIPDPSASDFDEEEKQIQALLLKAINKLPPRQREILYLRYYQGLSFDEITLMMSWSRKTAYNLVFKALKSIRENLKHSDPGKKLIFLLLFLSLSLT